MRLRTTAGRLGRAAWENSYFDGGLVTLRVNGQFGPRQMWDEAEAAHRWWIEHGSLPVDRWRFTVTPEGQRIDLT